MVYSNCQCSSAFCFLRLTVQFIKDSFVAISWERAVPLAFHSCYFYFSAVITVGVPLNVQRPFITAFDDDLAVQNYRNFLYDVFELCVHTSAQEAC